MLTVKSENPRGFGRVLRDAGGSVQAIVEEADATPEQLHIRELNAGAYCFSADWLWEHLPRIPLSPKGEYYLTDLVGIAVSEGKTVGALVAEDPTETIGVNTRAHLAEAETAMRQRINQMWMQAGVMLKNPASTFIDASVTIGRNTTIWPDTYLLEKTCVGENCVLGPNTVLLNARVGSSSVVRSATLEGVKLGDGERVGPYRYLCAEEK
jgi:bifunctional UDP-N-acetylglucosamine pyrophosphorylase/glucosamine-1-phosphate N-acetyltransferase